MTEQEIFEKIEAYLQNKLPDQERAAFEAQLNKDEGLAKKLQQQQIEHTMLEMLVEDDLLKKVGSWKEEEDQKRSSPFYFRPVYLAVAAFILILLTLLFLLLRTPSPPSKIVEDEGKIEFPQKENEQISPNKEDSLDPNDPEKEGPAIPEPVPHDPPKDYFAIASQFDQNFDHDLYRNASRGATSELELALDDYENHQYKEGIQKLENLLQKEGQQDNLDAVFYLGIGHYQDKAFGKAIPYLNRISKDLYLYNEQASWLLCLAYVKSGKIEASKTLLTQLKEDPEHQFHKQVTSLLKKLED